MDIPLIEYAQPRVQGSRSETAGLSTLYEDDALLAVDKPPGMVVHPAYKHPDATLADAVFARQASRGEGRPWLLHRLDRDTSGVVLFAKTEAARRAVVRQFERRTVKKLYLALAASSPAPASGAVEAPLARDPADRRRTVIRADGQPAVTRYLTIEAGPWGALLLVRPVTGRTHQIRAHLAHIGAPILGDATYLPPRAEPPVVAPRVLLHAWRIEFLRPGLGTPQAVTSPPPSDFMDSLARCGLHMPTAEHLAPLLAIL